MLFTPIDLQNWPRGQMFYYFSTMAPTGYSMTVNVDVTELPRAAKEAGVKFFPAYLWLVTKNLNEQMEFKVAERDGVLGYYGFLHPMGTVSAFCRSQLREQALLFPLCGGRKIL